MATTCSNKVVLFRLEMLIKKKMIKEGRGETISRLFVHNEEQTQTEKSDSPERKWAEIILAEVKKISN